MTTDHTSDEAGSVPSSASVAPPENTIGSPTFHVNAPVGAEMTGSGGVLFTVTTVEATSESPCVSVARTRTVTASGLEVVYVNCGATPVASSKAPSPSRSQAYVNV